MTPTPTDLLRLAADPLTSPEELARLAAGHPQLRTTIAANPAAYPALLAWLAEAGDAVVADASGTVRPDATGTVSPDAPLGDDLVGSPSQAPPSGVTVQRSPGRRRWIALAVASCLCLVLAAGAGGIFGGWLIANRLVVAQTSVTAPELITVEMPEYQPGATAVMPDIRGLSTAKATQAIVDSGIPISLISVVERPAAGAVGVIVQQTPVFGTENPTTVQILESVAAIVPDFANRSATDVIADLQGLGARVVQARQYVPGAQVGTVVSLTPGPGQTVPESVAIVVADSPSRVELSELDTTKGGVSQGSDVLVGGQNQAVVQTARSSSTTAQTVWVLDGHAVELTGSLGLEDDPNADATVTVVLRADGAEIARYVVAEGAPTPFTWTVTGVNTLTMELTSAKSTSTELVLIGAEVLGTADELAQLVTP